MCVDLYWKGENVLFFSGTAKFVHGPNHSCSLFFLSVGFYGVCVCLSVCLSVCVHVYKWMLAKSGTALMF